MAAVGGAEQIGNEAHLRLHLTAVMSMHHGKKIVGPFRHVAWSLVTMADEIQRPDKFAEFVHLLIGNVPYRHAVSLVAQCVMIGHRADAADHAGFEHAAHARHHLFRGNPYLSGNRKVGLRIQGQAGLGGQDNTAVDLVERRFGCHTASLNPTKYSLILGMS